MLVHACNPARHRAKQENLQFQGLPGLDQCKASLGNLVAENKEEGCSSVTLAQHSRGPRVNPQPLVPKAQRKYLLGQHGGIDMSSASWRRRVLGVLSNRYNLSFLELWRVIISWG